METLHYPTNANVKYSTYSWPLNQCYQISWKEAGNDETSPAAENDMGILGSPRSVYFGFESI